ncbi:hypothetical protein LSAT2_007215 [Lamellibrachia satsuma]|nr:hypothetical protein LSAT2_007215 [Lamellibrachia satsuma]
MRSGGSKEKRKTETEMGGLREEIFGGNVRACRTRASGGAVETSGGDDSEFTGLQTIREVNKHGRRKCKAHHLPDEDVSPW